jgi:hypothetical protein
MIDPEAFPRLTPTNHRQTSPATSDYNCIAWSAGDTRHWWQPGVFWPAPAAPGDFGIKVLVHLFETLGFQDCALDTTVEAGFEKVALFGDALYYTHAAWQLPNGIWTSKLGRADDIEHDSPHDVAGGIYGETVTVMKRSTAVAS